MKECFFCLFVENLSAQVQSEFVKCWHKRTGVCGCGCVFVRPLVCGCMLSGRLSLLVNVSAGLEPL